MNNKYTLILTALLLSGCSTFNLDSFKDIAKSFNFNSNINTLNYYEIESKALILNLNNNSNDVFKLQASNNSLNRWVNENELYLTSFKGKLLRSSGYNNNFNIIYNSRFIDLLYKDGSYIDAFISFTNPPSGILDIKYTYKLVKSGNIKMTYSNKYEDYDLIEETFVVPKIRWSGKNYYWIDKNGKVLKSKQVINPNGDRLYFESIN
jgi:hypothetical protein